MRFSIVIAFYITVTLLSVSFFYLCYHKSSTILPAKSFRIHHEKRPLQELLQCGDRDYEMRISQRGAFRVYSHVFRAARHFRCDESVTFTTHAEFGYLRSVEALVRRWRGPVVVTVYAPGDDFFATVKSLLHMRACDDSDTRALIREFVTFNLFHDAAFTPNITGGLHNYLVNANEHDDADCDETPPYKDPAAIANRTRLREKLHYPINVARNIAIETAQTHFVLPCDVEILPSTDVIQPFLDMLRRQPDLLTGRRSFVLPVFDVTAGEMPETKRQLQRALSSKNASVFNVRFCKPCHTVPRMLEWIAEPIQADEEGRMSVFSQARRTGTFHRWEPIHIGTQRDPWFSEEITWEGKCDKMVKDYVLCVMNYEMMVLDHAFVAHEPGRKAVHGDLNEKKAMAKIIREDILPVLWKIYGMRKECVVGGELTGH